MTILLLPLALALPVLNYTAAVPPPDELLPPSLRGTFGRGAPVRIVDSGGDEIARALVNYPSADLARIMGRRSGEIVDILGDCEYEEVVHRDNLVLT